MEYLIITAAFFVLMLVYFKLADHFNIIDKPNHRSAHSEITLRGGGIIFPIAFLFFLGGQIFFHAYQFTLATDAKPNFWIFGAGLLIICLISFIDDITDLSSKLRLLFHVLAVSLLLNFLNIFQLFHVGAVLIGYIFIIGILNAYNFMDGINGMSGLYSVVVLGSLWYVNLYIIEFAPANFIIYPLLACGVFLFFNFRAKAKCFLGDIGSLGLAFWVMALLGMLMIKTGELKWILFLTVYGTETILTIIERLRLKENIFDAHRRHLYQLFVNEKKISHLKVSFWYAFIQLLVCAIVIFANVPEWLVFIIILLPAILLYLFIKINVKKQIVFVR